jgi:glycosyltransferase involved in cell wall biosynthesis
VELYGKSSIYWHAAGFNEEDPAKMEHFGITTVEAMAGGCVPVVINKGGQVEIVDEGVNGFRWDDLSSLENKTLDLVNNKELLQKMSKKAIEKSKIFSKEKFAENLENLIKD